MNIIINKVNITIIIIPKKRKSIVELSKTFIIIKPILSVDISHMFMNQDKSKEYLMRILEGKCTGMTDEVVMNGYGRRDSRALNEEIERISEALGVDVGFLIKNSNELYEYFQVLSSLLLT